jgi:predicted RNA binding protein YcfA (HicA-like mRNA interferase family)
MPSFGPTKRKDLIKALKKAGFEGPFAGGKHEFLVKGELRLVLPNPHQSEISKDLLRGFSNKQISVVKTGKRYNNEINGDVIP